LSKSIPTLTKPPADADDPIAISSDEAMRSSMDESMRHIPLDLDELLKSERSGYGSGIGSGVEADGERASGEFYDF
jgi:hypothetical protein